MFRDAPQAIDIIRVIPNSTQKSVSVNTPPYPTPGQQSSVCLNCLLTLRFPDLSNENEPIVATDTPTAAPTAEPTVAPTAESMVAPTAEPTALVIEKADEDPEELEENPDPPSRTIDGGNGLSPGGIIGISIGSAFLILAAIGIRRSRRNPEDDEASVALNPVGVSADPGDFGPV